MDNGEQPHEMPEALRSQQNQQTNTEILGNATRSATSNAIGQGLGCSQQDANPGISGNATSNHTNYQRENTATGTGRSAPRGTQGQTNGSFPYRNPRYDEQRGTQPQAQFDKRFN